MLNISLASFGMEKVLQTAVMKFVSSQDESLGVEGIFFLDGESGVAMGHGARLHFKTEREKACHGIGASGQQEALAQKHESTAFGIDGQFGFGCLTHGVAEGFVPCEALGAGFGKTSPNVKGIKRWQFVIFECAARNDLGAKLFERLDVFRIIELECRIAARHQSWGFGNDIVTGWNWRRLLDSQWRGLFCQGEQCAPVHVLLDGFNSPMQGLLHCGIFVRRNDAEVAVTERWMLQARNGAEHGDPAIIFNGAADCGFVSRSSDVVQDHACQVNFRIEDLCSLDEGGYGSRDFGTVDNEDHGGLEALGQFGGGEGAAFVHAVIKAAVAFD